jgi:lipopolysaccharide export system permease protein
VLLASVMVMGNLAEQYELSSFKSAGVSLYRLLAPLMVMGFLVGLFSFFCSNTIIPIANLKYQSRLYDIRNQKPTLSIEPGVFNEDFHGYSIRVGKKDKDKVSIEDIMVYDDSQRNRGKLSVVTAQRGKMYVSKEDGAFVMTLYDGYQYAEADAQGRADSKPFMISHFDEWTRRFDLGEFDLDRTEEEQFKTHHTMKSSRQIASEIDTMTEQINLTKMSKHVNYLVFADSSFASRPTEDNPAMDSTSNVMVVKDDNFQRGTKRRDSAIPKYQELLSFLDTTKMEEAISLYHVLPAQLRREYRGKVNSKISVSRSSMDRSDRTIKRLEDSKRRHLYELHWKFSLAVSCIVMLLIGGPMGAIVRKGGFGYPFLVSIFFFTFFLMSNISCKKLSDSEQLPPVLAAWMPVMLLFLVSAFLTYKALQDSKIMDTDRLKTFFAKLPDMLKTRTA